MRLLLSCGLLALALAAQAVETLESVMHATVPVFGRPSILVTVHRPEGEGPFPIVVMSHGSPRSADDRRKPPRQRMAPQAARFVAMGFAVVVPTRRGYGESDGPFAEGAGRCDDSDYVRAGEETTRDILAALDAVRAEKWADGEHVLLVGQSAGAFGSVAAASRPVPGLRGVISFAGGRGSSAPDQVCSASHLVDAMAKFGKTTRVPELWIYSMNDHFFGPDLAQRMHAAFASAGGTADFVQVKASGTDGHGYFSRELDDWTPRVEAFVDRVGARVKR